MDDDNWDDDVAWGAGDNGPNWHQYFVDEDRVEDGRGDYRVLWDQEPEVVDEAVLNEQHRERMSRRARVALEQLRRTLLELEAQESAGGPEPQTSSGKRKRAEEGETSGQKKPKKGNKRKRKRRRK